MHRVVLVTLMVYLWALNVMAMSVGYENSITPFTIDYSPQSQAAVDSVLQLINDDNAAAVVLSWQLQLEIRPLSGAHGHVLFQSVSTPPDSLFGDNPGPTSDLNGAASTLLGFDADTTTFTGVSISQQSARNIIRLSMQASSDASGSFQILMARWDPASPNDGSSWFPADANDPVAFNNSANSGDPRFVLLGAVNISAPILPGDFDGDGVVGPLDYDRWRNQFATTVTSPGYDADGNKNLVVDAADYVVWRANLPASQSSNLILQGESLVPEVDTVTLAVVVLITIPFIRPGCRLLHANVV
jgi:hypothetical protein